MSKPKETSRTYAVVPDADDRGGAGSGGQSGDTQGLSDIADAGSESVQELIEEGQYFEAEVLLGVEAAEDEVAEVHTHEDGEKNLPPKKAGKRLR